MKLKIDKVTKTFGVHHALDELSLDVDECSTLAVVGPSGSGKSTLLRLLAGLECPDRGSISVNDQQLVFEEDFLRSYRRTVGTVFQAFNLFPHLTALENIILPLHQVHGLSREEAHQRGLEFLERFDLKGHAFKKPAELSGGQCQRVAIVRAVAIRSSFLLLDEPTSALDPLMTSEVLDLILELKQEGKHIVLISHHLTFVKKIADWIAYIEDGKVLELAKTAAFFASPSHPQTKQYLAKVLKY